MQFCTKFTFYFHNHYAEVNNHHQKRGGGNMPSPIECLDTISML